MGGSVYRVAMTPALLLVAALTTQPEALPEARVVLDRLLAESQVAASPGNLTITTAVRGSNQPGVCERDVLRIAAVSAPPAPKTGYDPRTSIRGVESSREYALIAIRNDVRAWSAGYEAACAEAATNDLRFVRAESPWEPWVAGQLLAQVREEQGFNRPGWTCRGPCPSPSAAREMLRPDRLTTVRVRLDGCPDEEICLEASFRTANYQVWRISARARREYPQTRVSFDRVQVALVPQIPLS